MSMIEKLAGAKALIEAAIEEELQRSAPPAAAEETQTVKGDCEHKNSEEITGAGMGSKRRACVDCGHTWEVE